MGHHRCVGEHARERGAKLVMEASVRNEEASKAMRVGPRGEASGLCPYWTREGFGPAWILARNRQGYSQPPSASKVSSHEHVNLEPSVDRAKIDTPPGTARSRSRGGVLVVVGARESRAQGEGGQ